jgi:DNA-binding response OmpR family regulator
VRVDGRHTHLTYREFELLSYFLLRPACTVSREELIREVWRDSAPGWTHAGSQRTVDTHVRRLRAKLGPYARVATTVRGHGYRCDPGSDTDVRSA